MGKQKISIIGGAIGIALMVAMMVFGGQGIATADGISCGSHWSPSGAYATEIDELATSMVHDGTEVTLTRAKCVRVIAQHDGERTWIMFGFALGLVLVGGSWLYGREAKRAEAKR